MIKSKSDLYEYLEADKMALGIDRKYPLLFRDEIWRFERLLRFTEYAANCNSGVVGKIRAVIYKIRFHHLSVKLGFSIPLNVFGKGLSIAHYGAIVVNHTAKVGEYCRIHENTTIGATGGASESPIIGDRVFIGSGARIIGNIKIANDVVIGAGSVVVKSFEESGVTIAGVPAKKISDIGSKKFLRI